MTETKDIGHHLRVNTAGLLAEILTCTPKTQVFKIPFLTLDNLLRQVAARAIELNDDKLNMLMLKLSLYSISDPQSPDFDNKKTTELIEEFHQKTK